MAVIIGSARSDENGKSNGKLGDQKNGKEVSTQNWYLHKKGWVIIRAKDPEKRKKIAYAFKAACDNNNFGYGQSTKLTGYNAAAKVGYDPAKVKTKVNIDCSTLARLALAYAGIKVPDWYTGNMVSICKRKPSTFEIITGSKAQTDKYLEAGDILVTKTKGHTVGVISTGKKTTSKSTTTNPGANMATPGEKSVTAIAKEVIDGKWGSGSTRTKKLKAAGYDAAEVQAEVNRILKGTKTVAEIAKEVLAGKWGNVPERKKKLTEAGYDYEAVQKEVNKLSK